MRFAKEAEALVLLPVPLVFLGFAVFASRRIRARFDYDERGLALVAAAFAAVLIMTAVLAVDRSWAWALEVARLGDQHLSHRAWRQYWPQREWVTVFVSGIVAFVGFTAMRYRRTAG